MSTNPEETEILSEALPIRIKAKPTIYIIRHGEKPAKDAHHEDVNGLSPKGKARAIGLVDIFGPSSQFKIGCIFAQAYRTTGARKRPYDTVFPLAQALNLPINTSYQREDARGVAEAALYWRGDGNVLICWEHKMLKQIIEEVGVEGSLNYPDDRFDVIWVVKSPYEDLHSWTSEGVKGLDEEFVDPY